MVIKKFEFDGIILAAGLSSRMKDWKPGIKINDFPVIIHTIKPMLDHCRKVFVVGGYNFEKLQRIINEENYFSKLQHEKIVLVKNENYTLGMFSSVKTGLLNIKNSPGTIIIPGDIPFVKSSTYSNLKNNFSSFPEIDLFIPTAKVEMDDSPVTDMVRKGHPVLLRKNIFNNIISYLDEENLRDVLEEFSAKYCLQNDQGIFMDIDDKNDLERVKNYLVKLR